MVKSPLKVKLLSTIVLFPSLLFAQFERVQSKKIDKVVIVMESYRYNEEYFNALKKFMKKSLTESGIESTFYISEELKLKVEKIRVRKINESRQKIASEIDSMKVLLQEHREKIDGEITELIRATSPNFIMTIDQTRHTTYVGSFGNRKSEIGAFEIKLFETENDEIIWERYQEAEGIFKLKAAARSASKKIIQGLKKDQLL